MLADQIERHQPDVKVDWENNSTEKLWTLLRSLPLSQEDKIFVELKESESRKCVELQLTSEEEQGSAFIMDIDKLLCIVSFNQRWCN